MEDINNWEAKYVNCKYAERLLSKLSELNQQVTIPVNINMVKKGICYNSICREHNTNELEVL